MIAPMDGLRVVEIANFMAAPGACALFADMGAEVIKIEPPRGDILRNGGKPPEVKPGEPVPDTYFEFDNRGKKSVVVNLDSNDGPSVVRRLLTTADVLVSNLTPPRQKKYGLQAGDCLAHNPNLIYAHLSGYGIDGPEADRPGFDLTAFFARGGVMGLMGEPDWVPMLFRPAQGDHTTSLNLAMAVLAALRVRDATGEGQHVEVSLMRTAAWTIGSDLATALVDRRQPTKRTRENQTVATSSRYRCGDGLWVNLTMTEERYWPVFVRALGAEWMLEDERFSTPRLRFRNMATLVETIDGIMGMRSRDEWGKIFDEHGVIWGPVATIADVVDDAQARANRHYTTINHPEHGPFETVATPFDIIGADIGVRRHAPKLGEHTDAVLLDAGYSTTELAKLREANVVG